MDTHLNANEGMYALGWLFVGIGGVGIMCIVLYIKWAIWDRW